MYDYISGTLCSVSPTEITIDNNGIGYKILISLQTYEKISKSEKAKIYIHHLVKEDDEALYGFFDTEERTLFEHLISVSGIGPGSARMMLSSLSTQEIRTAIIAGDVNKIKSVKGIGLKTAQKAIIELKDKIGKGSSSNDLFISPSTNSARAEASSALVLLGFNKPNVEKALDMLLSKEPDCSLEEMIKKALKML